MTSNRTVLFCIAYAAFTGFIAGYLMDKGPHEDTPDLITQAYARGRQAGYSQAQKNGACIQWWTNTSADDMRAAKRFFCKGR